MNKKKEFVLIEGTVFPFDVLYSTACTEKIIKYIESNKKYKLNDEEKEKLEMHGKGRTVQLRGGQVIMRVRKEKTGLGIDLPVLAHEIEHAVYFILEKVGLQHSNDSDEVYGYFSEYLMRQVLSKIDN